MRVALGVMLLSAMFAGSAYAAGSSVAAGSLLGKDLSVQSMPSTTKKSKPLQSRKSKSSGKVGAMKADPKAKQKQDSMTETPPDSAEQSVQLRGVRG